MPPAAGEVNSCSISGGIATLVTFQNAVLKSVLSGVATFELGSWLLTIYHHSFGVLKVEPRNWISKSQAHLSAGLQGDENPDQTKDPRAWHFMGHFGTPAVPCSFKVASGFIYPLERGIIFVYEPPILSSLRMSSRSTLLGMLHREELVSCSVEMNCENKLITDGVYECYAGLNHW